MTTSPSPTSLEFLHDEFKLLQGSRDSLISLNDRQVNFFLAVVSGAAVLLAFLNQPQRSSLLSNIASLTILLTIFLLGIMTFARTIEADIGIAIYARGLNRIRRFFVERDKKLVSYLILPTNDQVPSFESIGFSTKGASVIGLPNTLAVINSIVGAFLIGIILKSAFNTSDTTTLISSSITILISFFFHQRHQLRRRREATNSFKTQFPESISDK